MFRSQLRQFSEKELAKLRTFSPKFLHMKSKSTQTAKIQGWLKLAPYTVDLYVSLCQLHDELIGLAAQGLQRVLRLISKSPFLGSLIGQFRTLLIPTFLNYYVKFQDQTLQSIRNFCVETDNEIGFMLQCSY